MQECFQNCSSYGCGCIALPPLGVGRLYKYQPSIVAESMMASVLSGTRTMNLQVSEDNLIIKLIYQFVCVDIYQVL